jgi:hypothetical protein
VIRLNGIGGVTFQKPGSNFRSGFLFAASSHPEQSAAKSKDLAIVRFISGIPRLRSE